MKQSDVENAIKARIFDADLGWPIAWPNQDFPAPSALPRLEVNIDRNGSDDRTLTGDAYHPTFGLIRVLVIVQRGTSTDAANDMADDVAALFVRNTRMYPDGGTVIITAPADQRAGFIDGANYAIPVVVPYRAEPI